MEHDVSKRGTQKDKKGPGKVSCKSSKAHRRNSMFQFSSELEVTGLSFTSMRHAFQTEGVHGEAMCTSGRRWMTTYTLIYHMRPVNKPAEYR
jgi:hypothetical protein